MLCVKDQPNQINVEAEKRPVGVLRTLIQAVWWTGNEREMKEWRKGEIDSGKRKKWNVEREEEREEQGTEKLEEKKVNKVHMYDATREGACVVLSPLAEMWRDWSDTEALCIYSALVIPIYRSTILYSRL